MKDYLNAMNEVYTWNQMTRPSWGPLEFVTRGSMPIEVPQFELGEFHGTTFEEFSGNIVHKDMEVRQPYVPDAVDLAATDWIYWFHPESK